MIEECSADWLRQALEYNTALLMDCRPQNDFQDAHIVQSLNVNLPPLLQRRLKKGNLSVSGAIKCSIMKEKFLHECKCKDIVLFDGMSSDMNANTSSLVQLLHDKLLEDGCRVKHLNGGFLEFQLKYPECITGCSEKELMTVGLNSLSLSDAKSSTTEDCPTPSASYPAEIIPNLYLGNAKNAMDYEVLQKLNIKYILNVTPNIANHFENEKDFKYMKIEVNDHWSQNLSIHFPDAIAFIDEGRSKGVGVLVHCLAGISRSVTITVAYLMTRQNMSLDKAYDFVKKAKPDVSPNFNFMGQLLDYEQTLTPKDCHDCGKSNCVCDKQTLFFTTPTKSAPNYELERLTPSIAS